MGTDVPVVEKNGFGKRQLRQYTKDLNKKTAEEIRVSWSANIRKWELWICIQCI